MSLKHRVLRACKKTLFPTLTEAGEYLGVSSTTIRNAACRGDFIKNIFRVIKQADGSIQLVSQERPDKANTSVKVLNTKTRLVTGFYSQSGREGKFLGVTRSAVSMAIKYSNKVKDIYLITNATFSAQPVGHDEHPLNGFKYQHK